MKTLQTFALSMLLAATSAFSATTAAAPPAPASGVMPALTHAWSPEEIIAAAELTAVKTQLPTYATPDGKAFFDRLTATDYFTALTDPKVPLKTRIHQSAEMFRANGQLLVTYAHAADRGQAGHAEVTALDVQEMRFASMYAILVNQVFATANPKDPKVVTVKANLDSGFATLCATTLKILQLPHFMAPNDVTYELQALDTTIVRMNMFFTPATRTTLSQQLTALRPQLPNAGDQKLVDHIVKTLAA